MNKTKRTPSAWTQEEINVMYREYPTGGGVAVRKLLPNRTRLAIKNAANRLNLATRTGSSGSPRRDDFAGTPVHDYTQPDVAVRDWGRPADAPRLQLFGLVGVEMEA